jgi:hypothetical protein
VPESVRKRDEVDAEWTCDSDQARSRAGEGDSVDEEEECDVSFRVDGAARGKVFAGRRRGGFMA